MMTKQAELKKQAYASSLKSRSLLVLIYLIDRSNKDLTCFPAIPTMAEQLHISISTVKRALHELVQAGFIKKDARFRDNNRGQTSNLYTLMLKEQMPDPMKCKTPIVPVSTVKRNINQSSEKKTTCVVKHITFEELKEKMSQSDNDEILLACKSEDIIMNEKPYKRYETVKQNQIIRQIQNRNTVKLINQQGALCELFQWTGVGVNLQPP